MRGEIDAVDGVEIENLGPYLARAEIEGHEFYAEADRRGGIRIWRQIAPPGCNLAEPGDPLYRRAKSILGQHFRKRRGDLRGTKPRTRRARRAKPRTELL